MYCRTAGTRMLLLTHIFTLSAKNYEIKEDNTTDLCVPILWPCFIKRPVTFT